MKAAKQNHPESVPRTFLSSATFLVLKHKLNKIYLENFLGFPLDFYLGEPNMPTPVTFCGDYERTP